MRDYATAVFVGRFQPFHDGHKSVIEQALEVADKVLVLVGSATAARSPKNPLTFVEREILIRRSLDDLDGKRVTVQPLRDFYYNENAWLASVQNLVATETRDGMPVALVGQYKDASSYYLKQFPQWEFIPMETPKVAATSIREVLYREFWDTMPDYEGKFASAAHKVQPVIDRLPAPDPVKDWLTYWVGTKQFANAVKEWKYVTEYKLSWASAPFTPTFVTTDAVVVSSGHVLVVERKVNPGKGLFALPGGFVKQNEPIQDGAIRELREETAIKVDKLILESSIEGTKVFDHPDRSARGRTISHGFYFRLKDGELPEVKGGDDAERAFWMPLMDVARAEDRFFEDHAHIIHYFTSTP